MSKVKKIKPLDGFSNVLDGDVVSRGTNVQTNMTGNPNFPTPPVDLAALKTNIDSFSALIAEGLDGSKKVIAEKNKQRETVINMLRALARYVELNCNNDMAIFQTSGFQPASTTKAQTPPLSEKIRKIEHGANSGQIVVWLKAVLQAFSYEVRYAAAGADGTLGAWTTQAAATVRPPATIIGLTPGTAYAFQARWLGKSGHCDWSDSIIFICT
jgi:hypothetical protein